MQPPLSWPPGPHGPAGLELAATSHHNVQLLALGRELLLDLLRLEAALQGGPQQCHSLVGWHLTSLLCFVFSSGASAGAQALGRGSAWCAARLCYTLQQVLQAVQQPDGAWMLTVGQVSKKWRD